MQTTPSTGHPTLAGCSVDTIVVEETQDHSWGTNPRVYSSKSSSSNVKSKRLLWTVPVESGGCLAILRSDRMQQFKSDRAFGVIILAIKSPGVLFKVIIIKREVKALALNCARGKQGTFSHSLLGQVNATIQIRPRFWGNYPCDKIVTTGLLYCVTCLLYLPSGEYNKHVMP